MTRNNLEKRISLLTSELAEVGTLVEKQIYDSIIALKSNDLELANEIIKISGKVTKKYKTIQSLWKLCSEHIAHSRLDYGYQKRSSPKSSHLRLL